MEQIENVSIKRYGNSWYVLIPADFVKHKKVDPEKKYDVWLNEVNGRGDED